MRDKEVLVRFRPVGPGGVRAARHAAGGSGGRSRNRARRSLRRRRALRQVPRIGRRRRRRADARRTRAAFGRRTSRRLAAGVPDGGSRADGGRGSAPPPCRQARKSTWLEGAELRFPPRLLCRIRRCEKGTWSCRRRHARRRPADLLRLERALATGLSKSICRCCGKFPAGCAGRFPRHGRAGRRPAAGLRAGQHRGRRLRRRAGHRHHHAGRRAAGPRHGQRAGPSTPGSIRKPASATTCSRASCTPGKRPTDCGSCRRRSASAVDEMIGELCRQAGIARDRIYEVAFAGNTTMQQLLCGVDTEPAGRGALRAGGRTRPARARPPSWASHPSARRGLRDAGHRRLCRRRHRGGHPGHRPGRRRGRRCWSISAPTARSCCWPTASSRRRRPRPARRSRARGFPAACAAARAQSKRSSVEAAACAST